MHRHRSDKNEKMTDPIEYRKRRCHTSGARAEIRIATKDVR